MNVPQQPQTPRIPYDKFDCGGPEVHGTDKCVIHTSIDPSGFQTRETTHCACKSRKKHNYALLFILGQTMESVKKPPHLFRKGESGVNDAWESVAELYFKQPALLQYLRPGFIRIDAVPTQEERKRKLDLDERRFQSDEEDRLRRYRLEDEERNRKYQWEAEERRRKWELEDEDRRHRYEMELKKMEMEEKKMDNFKK